MAAISVPVAFALGVLQGVFEWLPISSEGNTALVLTVVFGLSASDAVGLSLFLHAGTAIAAAVYYRGTIVDLLQAVPDWEPQTAFSRNREAAELSFLVVATLASFGAGLLAYAVLTAFVSELTGGAFVLLIGVLLVVTGLFQRVGVGTDLGERQTPDGFDAVLTGGLQGLAVLPGVSRSGVTTGALLLRGYEDTTAFRLSFLLSIPAAAGAATLVVLDTGGLPAIGTVPALVALATSAVVGHLTIDALLRLVERVPFWIVCLGLGALAVVGGALLFLRPAASAASAVVAGG
jgi:undecaprenyl-diphosphatase